MSDTDAGLAENITEIVAAAERTGGNVYVSIDRQQRLRIAASRLEARGEITEAMITAVLLELTRRFGALVHIRREDARAALEAAQKGETP